MLFSPARKLDGNELRGVVHPQLCRVEGGITDAVWRRHCMRNRAAAFALFSQQAAHWPVPPEHGRPLWPGCLFLRHSLGHRLAICLPVAEPQTSIFLRGNSRQYARTPRCTHPHAANRAGRTRRGGGEHGSFWRVSREEGERGSGEARLLERATPTKGSGRNVPMTKATGIAYA